MPGTPVPALTEWETFYVIVGSSSGALIGLMFVVIALGSERRTSRDTMAVHAFASPTLVHFGVVLLMSTLMVVPRLSLLVLHVAVVGAAVWGLTFVGRALVLGRRQRSYAPVRSDWVWHVVLPGIAYVHLFFAGFALGHAFDEAFYGVAITSLVLLFIGIHNAWDSAVWMAIEGVPEERPPS